MQSWKKSVIDYTFFLSRRLHSHEMRQVFFVRLTGNSYSQAYLKAAYYISRRRCSSFSQEWRKRSLPRGWSTRRADKRIVLTRDTERHCNFLSDFYIGAPYVDASSFCATGKFIFRRMSLACRDERKLPPGIPSWIENLRGPLSVVRLLYTDKRRNEE